MAHKEDPLREVYKSMGSKEDPFESFINKVDGYEEALRQEHEVASAADDVETVRKLIDAKIAKALPGFVDDLILIARTGDTDSSRLKAIQWAFNWYFKENSEATDPFAKLLGELTKNDQNPQLRPAPPE